MNDNWIKLIEALVPLIIFVLGAVFKTGQTQREELAHALHTALGRYRNGKIEKERAKEIVLATGVVSERKVDKVLREIELRVNDEGRYALHKENVVRGVGVEIDTRGDFRVDPTGMLNNKAHKLNKWTKKKLGIKIF